MLDLDGSWEIGLAEIQYPHSWYNVRINEVWVLFTDRHHENHILVLPEGYYASPKRIVKALEANTRTENLLPWLRLPRTVLYNLRVENSACRTPGTNPDARAYHEYYLNQAGRGYPVYVGTRYQRGHGLGSIFGSLFKSAVPLLKRGAKTLGREALSISYHPRFDQGAIHVQRIYSPGYVCHIRCFIISGWKIQLVEPQERL
jgi:hypothetical protein